MGRAVGIDLGTTNSVVSVLEGGESTVIANSEGSRTTPSVVAFAKNGEILVGQSAKNQAVTNVDRTIRSVKRHIGTDWKINIDDKDYTSQEISARTLMKLKRDAEAYLGEDVTDAVITVPAYFEDAQRQATKEAGQIAGLNVLRIVNEPTAAALAYGLEKGEQEQTILVFDLGGGTFDVSLLEIGDGVVEVMATAGDNELGGDDWDQRIVDWLVDRFKTSQGVDLTKDKRAVQRLREAAEKAKIELSSSQQANINLPYITVDSDKNPLFLDETLTRTEFQKITQDLLDRTKAPFNQVIKDADLSVGDIDHVVLVGGSTRMPAVSDLVKELTGKENTIKIQDGSGLSQEEIDRMVKDAEQHAEEDKKRREEQELRNNAESTSYQTRKFLDDNADKVSEDVKTKVTEAADAVDEALKGDDLEAIKSAVEKLSTESQEMGKQIYEAQAAEAGAEGAADAGAAQGDPNVVDAEVVDEDENKDGNK